VNSGAGAQKLAVSSFNLVVAFVGMLFFEAVTVAITFDALSSPLARVGSLSCLVIGVAAAGLLTKRSFRKATGGAGGKRGSSLAVVVFAAGGLGVALGSQLYEHITPAVMLPPIHLLFGFVLTVAAQGVWARFRPN